MANLVKQKSFGFGFSLLLLLIVFSQFRFKKNVDEQYKIWSPDSILYENDFQRTAPYFHYFDAHISSGVHIIQDKDGVKALTKINRFKSWIKPNINSPALLTHEAYHANITALDTKVINDAIADKNYDFKDAIKLTDALSYSKNDLQVLYDKETNHSLNRSMQHYWEYKIDSMYNSGGKLDTLDIFGGASAYFPSQPTISVIKDTFMLLKDMRLTKYDMVFSISTHYDENIDISTYEKWYVQNQFSNGSAALHTNAKLWSGLYMLEANWIDTLYNELVYERIIVNGLNTYQLTVNYPLEMNDSLHSIMKETFFSSFNLVSNNERWLNYLEQGGEKVVFKSISKPIKDKKNDSKAMFTSLSISDNSLFYSYPFINKNSVIIAYKSARHPTNDLRELMVVLNDSIKLTLTPDSLYQVFPINISNFSNGRNKIQFGYFTKSDSTRKIPHFYSSIINNFFVEK